MHLTCFVAQVELSKSYGKAEWRDDLKKLVLDAGTGQRPIVFLFNDTQVCAPLLCQLCYHFYSTTHFVAHSLTSTHSRKCMTIASQHTVVSLGYSSTLHLQCMLAPNCPPLTVPCCWPRRAQIKWDGMVEDVNNLLNSGEVPNLFANDEKAEILDKVHTGCSFWFPVCSARVVL